MHDNERQEVKCKLGDNLLDVIVEEDLDIDGFGENQISTVNLVLFVSIYFLVLCSYNTKIFNLTHCGLVMPYDDIRLGDTAQQC